MIARFFPLFPPRSASFRPQRRRSLSAPNGFGPSFRPGGLRTDADHFTSAKTYTSSGYRELFYRVCLCAIAPGTIERSDCAWLHERWGGTHGLGRRREPRKDIQAHVRIFGSNRSGQVFSEKAVTVNVSQQGVE